MKVELFAAATILPAIWGWLVGRAAALFWRPRAVEPSHGESREIVVREDAGDGGGDYQI